MELGRWVILLIFVDIPLPDDTRCIFVLVRTQRFLTSDVGSMLKGRRPSWMLYRRQKISWPRLVENCRTGCLEPGRVATDVDSQEVLTFYDILHHIYILIILWQQLLFSSIPDSLKLPDMEIFSEEQGHLETVPSWDPSSIFGTLKKIKESQARKLDTHIKSWFGPPKMLITFAVYKTRWFCI